MRRREGEARSKVVEAPVRHLVTREEIPHVHVDREEIPDRIAVLRPVHAVHGSDVSRVDLRGLVDPPLEPAYQGGVGLGIRARHPGRGHHARPNLPDHPLPRLWIRGWCPDVERIERKAPGRCPGIQGCLVVAGDAVLIEGCSGAECTERGRRCGGARRRPGGRRPEATRQAHAEPAGHEHEREYRSPPRAVTSSHDPPLLGAHCVLLRKRTPGAAPS